MSDVVVLEGNWDFCFEPSDSADADTFRKAIPSGTRSVSLPFIWNTDEKKEAFAGFYFREFEVDKKESNKRFFIRFESVHHAATVWLNGEEIGNHLGGHTQFDVDGSKAVKVGEKNLLVVRVRDMDRQEKIDGISAKELPMGGIYDRGRFAGILGKVSLIMAGRAGIRSIICFPDYESDRLTIETRLWNPKNFHTDVTYRLTDPKGDWGEITKDVQFGHENDTHTIEFQINKGQAWDLKNPNLYQVEVSLATGFSAKAHFGIRRVQLERGVFQLNHQIFRVKGVGYPMIFPFCHGIPGFDYDQRKDLMTIKDAGFNMIRSGGAPFPTEVLNICDEIGLLVIQETACYKQRSNRESLDMVKTHIQTLIEKDAYHPCIFAWAIGSENGSMALENGNKLLRFLSELDPTRPVFSNLDCVQMDSLGGGKIDLGKVFEPTSANIAPFESHKLHITFPVSIKTSNLLSTYCSSRSSSAVADGIHGSSSFWERYNYLKEDLGGKILVNGLGTLNLENQKEVMQNNKKYSKHSEYHKVAKLQDQLDSVLKEKQISCWDNSDEFWKDAASLINQSLVKQADLLSINSLVTGTFYENWSDYGESLYGLTNWYRNPKSSLEFFKKINLPFRIATEAEVRTPYAGTSAAINIYMISDSELGDYGLLLRVKGPNGRIWHQESMPGKGKAGTHLVGKFKFPVGYDKGKFTFDLALSKSNKELTRTEEVFYVPPEGKLDDIINQTRFVGDFPESITAGSGTELVSHIIVRKLSEQSPETISECLRDVEMGKTLVLAQLTQEDAELLREMKIFSFPVRAFRCTGNQNPSFHYIQESPAFKNLPANCLMDQIYADVVPQYSLDGLKDVQIDSGSINFRHTTEKELRVRFGVNLASMPYGRGKIIFNQMAIFDKLGKNALADALFKNLLMAEK